MATHRVSLVTAERAADRLTIAQHHATEAGGLGPRGSHRTARRAGPIRVHPAAENSTPFAYKRSRHRVAEAGRAQWW